jgi:DNA transposition AAA+ family ATPase
MNAEIKRQTVDALETYMKEYRLSQNEIAKRSGVNAAYILEMRRGNDRFINKEGKEIVISDKYYEKIAQLVGFRAGKTWWDFRETEQAIEIMSILQDAKQYAYTNVIVGDTGCGKSFIVDLFRQKNPNDVFVVTVSQLDNIGDILDKIIDLLKIAPAKSKSRKMKDIVARLREMRLDGYTPMLVFDECEYMKQPALCAIKELYDGLNKYCAVVLVGHPQLINNIERLRKKSRDGIPQLYRRIKFGIRRLSPIDRKFGPFLENIRDAKLRKFLQTECENYGELHDVLVPALREAERANEAVSEDFVRQLLNMPYRA